MSSPPLRERFPVRDFEAFHEAELPRLLASGRAALAAADAAPVGSLALRVSSAEGASRAFTYVPTVDGVALRRGDAEADVVVELDGERWSDLVDDLESAPGLLYAGACRVVRGDPMRFVRWEPKLRALYAGRPVFDLEAPPRLVDRRGRALDPAHRCAQGVDREEMAHFLREAGYLVVRGVFAEDEIAALREDARALRAAAREGDGTSWWGRDAQGAATLCRVIDAARRDRMAALYADARILALVALSEFDLRPRRRDDDEAVSVLWKQPDMAEGLGDLPWHRDCGLGGHGVMCPLLIVTVNLTAGNAEAGELRMLPGSWRSSVPFFEATDARAPKGVGLRVDAGDVSLHYGDVMHAAPPPRRAGPWRDDGSFRTSVLLGFAREGALAHHRGEGVYNDVLLGNEDGQVEHLAKVAARSRPADGS
ncbi:MAG: phytanoyl-CoA dioxygenase family protein [Myxococcales bacterium]|nr:phytanoyl-CoA dioxygenase family protein [Myxococcales bacterium]